MLKIRCDRCLAEIENQCEAAMLVIQPKAFAPTGERGPIMQFELCNECKKKILDFLCERGQSK